MMQSRFSLLIELAHCQALIPVISRFLLLEEQSNLNGTCTVVAKEMEYAPLKRGPRETKKGLCCFSRKSVWNREENYTHSLHRLGRMITEMQDIAQIPSFVPFIGGFVWNLGSVGDKYVLLFIYGIKSWYLSRTLSTGPSYSLINLEVQSRLSQQQVLSKLASLFEKGELVHLVVNTLNKGLLDLSCPTHPILSSLHFQCFRSDIHHIYGMDIEETIYRKQFQLR